MQKKLIFLLAFMVLVAVFALQNSVEVELKLWFWGVRTSMVLIIILTFASGALAGILFSIPKKSKESKKKDPTPDKIPFEVSTGEVSPEASPEDTAQRRKTSRDQDPEFEDVNN